MTISSFLRTTYFFTQKINVKTTCAFLIVGIIASATSYGYLINQTVINVVERKASEEKIAELDTTLSGYEFEYISKTSHITLDDAIAMGYVEELSPTYVHAEGGSRLTYAQ